MSGEALHDLSVVLCTDRLSPSVRYRPFAEPVRTVPFLRWWCGRFRARHHSDLNILCHTLSDERAVSELVGDLARVIRVQSGTKLRAFARTAERLGTAHAAFVDYGYIFAPPTLLARAFAHHLQNVNAFTPVHGLPAGAAPEIYQTSILLELAALDIPGLSCDPADAIKRLAVIAPTFAELRSLAHSVVPFEAGRALGVRPRQLPERITISTPRDLQLVRRVVAAEHMDDGGALEVWRQAAIEVRREFAQGVRELVAATRVNPDGPTVPGGDHRQRVLFISEPAGFSGGEESLCQLISHLDRNAFELFALVGGEGYFVDRLTLAGVRVTVAPGGFGERDADSLFYVLRALHEVRPDVVHFNGPVDSPTLYAVLLSRVPFVAHARNAVLTGDLDALRLAARIVAVSEFMKDELLTLEIPDELVSVVYDEVDPEVFAPGVFDRTEKRALNDIPSDAAVVLMIARCVPHKRHDLLLQAALAAKARIPHLHLVLKADIFHDAGTPDVVHDYVDTYGMTSWVTIVPFVDDIRTMHCIADTLVLCSDGEALGRCVVEAMAMEVPVIVSDSGGTHEIVRHGETGFVFRGGDAGALADCLVTALSDLNLCRAMGRAARRFVVDHLTAHAAAATVTTLYNEITVERAGWHTPATCVVFSGPHRA